MDHSRALVGKHRMRGHKTKGYRHMRVCYLCGEPGHYRRNCPKNQDDCVRKTSMKSNHKAQPTACTQLEPPHEEPAEYLDESESTEGAFGASS